MSAASYILPVAVVIIAAYGYIKGVPVFDCFAEGAKKGFDTFLSLLPVLSGLILAVSMLRESGALDVIEKALLPAARFLGIPEEVIPLCILSPVSGSGSLSMYESILAQYGPDSAAGRTASVIAASTETTFYASAVYLGSVGIKKSGNIIPCALLGDFVSFITASLTVKYFF